MSSESTVQTPRSTVTLELPDGLLALLAPSAGAHDAGARLSELAIIELFREGRLSTGRAAHLLGLSSAAFVELLGRHGVPYLDDSEEELRLQVEASAHHRQTRSFPTAAP